MAAKIQQGNCALCLREGELCMSHIASKFLWRRSGVIGDKRSFTVSSPTHPHLDESNRQDGLKEYLLCAECEAQFNNYETYAASVLFQNPGPLLNRPKEHFVLNGLDYAKMKLFQMSILWRMGVSSVPFYCNVDLGDHAETLRKMLRSEDPGSPWQYGCIATLLEHREAPVGGIFSQPQRTRRFGRYCYSYAISGMHCYHFVTRHAPDDGIQKVVLRREGTWVLFRGEITENSGLRIEVDRLTK